MNRLEPASLILLGVLAAHVAQAAPLTMAVSVTDGRSSLPGAQVCLASAGSVSEGPVPPECRSADADGTVIFEVTHSGVYELSAELFGFFTTRVEGMEVGPENVEDGVAWRPEGCNHSMCLGVVLNPDWNESFTLVTPGQDPGRSD